MGGHIPDKVGVTEAMGMQVAEVRAGIKAQAASAAHWRAPVVVAAEAVLVETSVPDMLMA